MSDVQHFEDRFARDLRRFAATGAPTIGAEQVALAVAAGVAQHADRPLWRRWTSPQRMMLVPAGLIVAVVAVVALGLWVNGNHVVTPGGTPVPSATMGPRPSDAPSPVPTPFLTGAPGADLTWSKLDASALGLVAYPFGNFSVSRVMWIEDHFILADEALGTVRTSVDGVTWDVLAEGSRDLEYYEAMVAGSIASWQDQVVGWSTGASSVSIVQPTSEPVTHEFEGLVESAGIGPRGIVVRTHSTLDFDRYITSLLGPGWVEHMTDFSFTDGVLRITTDDDRDLELVWAETGYEPGDIADRGFGWFSVDGDEWTAIPEFPDNVSEVVGTSDGFIARGSRTWTSTDGLSWEEVGSFAQGSVVAWLGGVLLAPNGAADFEEFQFVTHDELGPLRNAPPTTPVWRSTGVGPLGLVAIRTDDSILYSLDGTDWSTSQMPEAMTADAARVAPDLAVGERSVVALVWKVEPDDSRTPSLWVGTVEP